MFVINALQSCFKNQLWVIAALGRLLVVVHVVPFRQLRPDVWWVKVTIGMGFILHLDALVELQTLSCWP